MLFHRNKKSFLLYTFVFLSLLGCASNSSAYSSGGMKNSPNMHKATMRPYVVNGKRYYPTMVSIGDHFSGMASWYGKDFHGKKTSNGEIYNMYGISAAHKVLPMNTMVKVTNLLNNRSLVVRINDRGPFVKTRIIDLSYGAAKRLKFAGRGTTPVRLEVVGFNGRASSAGSSYRYQGKRRSMRVGALLVQLGAFRRLQGAKSYGYKLKARYGANYKVLLKRSSWRGSYIYRVYLRGFQSEEEARDFIASKHFDGAFIVRDE